MKTPLWYKTPFFLGFISIILVVNILTDSTLEETKDVKGLSTVSFETEPTITINPDLNISRFLPYIISAENIPETPSSVYMEIWGLNGNSPAQTCWDYYVDGSCGSTNLIKTMTKAESKWDSPNIYPDSIYPEIYFANSQITWGNTPLSTSIRRNEYSIMHFNNPFIMVNDMSFFIEFNAYPNSSVNSADLQVYLISKETDITNFNESWFEKDNVELVGTFTKNSTYHHTHGLNSSHKLVALSTNSNGTVGPKNLDINGDFWIVLYSQSPNNARGWNLQHHPSSLCNFTNRWYQGNIQGWTTIEQAGCPDSHIHIARRNSEYMDGIGVKVTATYDTYQAVSEPVEFYFGELPNLPPSATSFTSPTIAGTYSETLNIVWEPATDPNKDTLYYNIYLKQGVNVVESFLNQNNTEILIPDTTYLDDGNYTVTGEVCDSVNPCVPFSLGGEFTIDNTLPIQTINSITLESTNSNPIYAKTGDTVTLVFTTTGTISSPTVEIYSGGDTPNGDISFENTGFVWTYTYTIDQNDTNGGISFSITSTVLDREYYTTTDSSGISVDTVPPQTPSSSLDSGVYASTSSNSTTLNSSGSSIIRYTTSEETLSCSQGTEYTSSISILSDTTLKAVACDLAGNISTTSTYEYLVKEDLLNISISSSNTNSILAKRDDVVSITFEASAEISEPVIAMYANGTPLSNPVSIVNNTSNIWSGTYLVSQDDPNGTISFEISSEDLYKTFDESTDSSSVNIDTIPPVQPSASVLEHTSIGFSVFSWSSIYSIYY